MLKDMTPIHKNDIITSNDDLEYIPTVLPTVPSTKDDTIENKTMEYTDIEVFDVDQSCLLNVFNLLSSKSSTSIFETFFDLTPERLDFIFQSFDTDEDNKISYESLRKGISVWADESQNLINDREFKKLAATLDSDASHDITKEEFGNGLQMIALRRLFSLSLPKPSELTVLDYDATKLISHTVSTKEQQLLFFHQKREAWVKCRWIDTAAGIHGNGGGAITLQRLAVKYRLHPLAVEDALEVHKHRPKVEQYTTHYVLLIPILSLTNSKKESFNSEDTVYDHLNVSNGSISNKNTVFSHCCCNRSRMTPLNLDGLKYLRVDMVSLFVLIPQNDTLITYQHRSNDSHQDNEDDGVWSRIKRGLNKTYSKLRQYDCQYLLYGMLDALVDRIPPIVEEMKILIQKERGYLLQNGYNNLGRVNIIRDELTTMIRQLKPFQRVLIHVIKDDAICKGATIYLHDVKDNLECCVDDLKDLLIKCDAISNEFEKFHQSSMDRTLYLMTVVTSIFLPAQFLTGVWGMNFVSMPELQTAWVYPAFWVFTFLFSIIMLYLFNCGRLNHR
jgi:Mg2+ and Co2+ transporter CorA